MRLILPLLLLAAHPAAAQVLVVHGGAGTIRREDMTPALDSAYRDALRGALERGYGLLERGGTSLDAVEAVIVMLEDSPLFNAGRGAVFTSAGTVELDAAIMDGATGAAGAVAGVRHVKNPVALARMVMARSPHVMLAGEGAEAFAKEQGVRLVPQKYFFTQRRWDALQAAKQARQRGTVGAVALDRQGRLAAATSTGGTTNKRPGRIGDTPVIGAGTYADSGCAVSGTGHGEYFIRNVVAHDICARLRYKGETLARAAESVVMEKLVGQRGEGGVIAIDGAGNVATPFNTDGMYRGWVSPSGPVVVKIYRDE
ncbi:MAG TPA: isoaspartyl peptidase/L-asparaginase [Gemmatimonadales bacterium]|nr:isoaspartyl peptidase/L-asparaginase [Gemmatimonadales bacterium]